MLQTMKHFHRQNFKIKFYFFLNISISILPFNSTFRKRLKVQEQAHSGSCRWCLVCFTLEMHQRPSLRNMQSLFEGGPCSNNFDLKILDLCFRTKSPKAQWSMGLSNQQPIQLLYMFLNTPFFNLHPNYKYYLKDLVGPQSRSHILKHF